MATGSLTRVASSRSIPPTVELSDEQCDVADYLADLHYDVQTLGGYGGTGKTTVIRALRERLPGFAVCAFTGKAANVLRGKGLDDASTIHSLIYKPHEATYRDKEGRLHTRVMFELRDNVDCRGFIVDEASMVSRGIYEDLRSFDRPLILVGDHGQLPPVSHDAFNPMLNPDLTLETVHRNAGEIAHFADFIRRGNPAVEWKRHPKHTGRAVRFTTLREMEEPDWLDDEFQVICAFNKTRVEVNKAARRALGRTGSRPVPDDRVMCLQNDHDQGLFNGMQGVVVSEDKGDMIFEACGRQYKVEYVPEQFHNEQRPEGRDPSGRVPFDFAYCVTCHKAQGDEWDHVVVIEQKCKHWEHARWAYTAASRARKRLTWVPCS
jgi:exodeoxyribonuclease-5